MIQGAKRNSQMSRLVPPYVTYGRLKMLQGEMMVLHGKPAARTSAWCLARARLAIAEVVITDG